MATPTYDLIDSQVLSTSAASVSFTSIPATYRDLVVVLDNIYNGSGGNASLRLTFNADTGANYSEVWMVGDGSSASSGSRASTSNGFTINATTSYQPTSTNKSGVSVIQVMDYTATDKHKSLIWRYNNPNLGTIAAAGRWANTGAITSLTFTPDFNDYAAGGTFYLYGIAS